MQNACYVPGGVLGFKGPPTPVLALPTQLQPTAAPGLNNKLHGHSRDAVNVSGSDGRMEQGEQELAGR